MMPSPIKTFAAGAMQVHVFSSKREASEVAAGAAAAILRGGDRGPRARAHGGEHRQFPTRLH